MHKIFCRFDNQDDIDKFIKDNNIIIDKDMREYNLDNGIYKMRKMSTFKKGINKAWEEYWYDMPYYIERQVYSYANIRFITEYKDAKELSKIFQQNVTEKTLSVWFPKLDRLQKTNYRVIGLKEKEHKPQYPIYVISKNRADLSRCLTAKYLNLMEVDHYLVVEHDEIDKYREVFKDLKYSHIIELDMRYKDEYDTLDNKGNEVGKGPGGTRNFCWQHSINNGYRYHWVMDDNIDQFFYLYKNWKYKCRNGSIFRIAEDFFTRFKNVAIGSLNYEMFADKYDGRPAFNMNTRMYSCVFIRNDIPYKWRGRYNEDTILSLDVLKDKWCTIQLNALLCRKVTTQRLQGGNTEMFYAKEGTYNKSKMLEDIYPQYCKMVYKFHRVHHYVDYSSFIQDLQYKDDYDINGHSKRKISSYDMMIVEIPSEWALDLKKDRNSYILEHLNECKIIDRLNELEGRELTGI